MAAQIDASFAGAGGLPSRFTQPEPGPLTRAASRHAQVIECLRLLRGDLAAVMATLETAGQGQPPDLLQVRERLAHAETLFESIEGASREASDAIAMLRADRGQLQSLCLIAEHLNSSLDRTELMPRVLDDLLRLVHADRAGLFLADSQGKPRFEAARQRPGEHLSRGDYPYLPDVVERVWRERAPILRNGEAEGFAHSGPGLADDTRYIMCAPLCTQTKVLGVVYLDRATKDGKPFKHDALDLLAAFCNEAAIALENATLFAQQRLQMHETHAMKTYTESVLLAISSGVLAIDNEGRVTRANRAIGALLGATPGDLLDQPLARVFAPLRDPAMEPIIRELLADDDLERTAHILTTVAGRDAPLALHFSWSVLRDPSAGRRLGKVIVVDDLSALEQAQILRRYVHPDVAQFVTHTPNAAELGGQTRDISILFIDIHGYTAMSEQLTPAQLVGLLNEYLSLMTRAIDQAGGTVTLFQGDAVMAIFNAPHDQPDHPLRAARAALAARRAVTEHRQKTGSQPVRIGIGLHSGPALVGNIGARESLQHFTAIGDSVNLTKRLEEHSGEDEILLSAATYQALAGQIRAHRLEPFAAKGKTQLIQAYALEALL